MTLPEILLAVALMIAVIADVGVLVSAARVSRKLASVEEQLRRMEPPVWRPLQTQAHLSTAQAAAIKFEWMKKQFDGVVTPIYDDEKPPRTGDHEHRPRPEHLLTDDERDALDATGELAGLIRQVIGDGPQAGNDWREAAGYIHGLQHLVMAQAAARAYPGQFRLLGEGLEPVFKRSPQP